MSGIDTVILGGDVIVQVLDVPIRETRSLFEVRRKFAKLSPGDAFPVVVIRNGVRVDLTGRTPNIRVDAP